MVFVELVASVVVYLIGAIPTGVIVARARGVDITTKGSGNVGATNVARVVGKGAGSLTLLGDILKGALGVLVGRVVTGSVTGAAVAGVLVVAGHCFSIPPWLKGGKGVATALGVIFSLSPIGAIAGLCAFAITFFLSRFVSLSSVVAAFVIPLAGLAAGAHDAIFYALVGMTLIVVARHRQNIERLIQGTEPKFSFGSGAQKAGDAG
jgi:glycerol-3-phosphate acyltransferase PlsY